MKPRILILLFTISNLTILNSQIVTDRPDQTEASIVLPSNNIQIETGLAVEKSQSIVNTLFRMGLVKGIEIRLNSNYIINDELSFLKKSSFGDFEVGTKIQILDNESLNTKIAFLTHLSIPTAQEVFSNNKYGLLSRVLISHELNTNSQIGYNIGYNKYKSFEGELIYTLAYSKSLGDFGVFFEIFGDKSKINSNINFDSGLTYLIDNQKQIDISIGKGLNNDLFYLSAGFSLNIN